MEIVFCYFILIFSVFATCQEVPRVDIPLGKIEGFLEKTINGKIFHAFEGIPYASPPIGKHRFKAPIPPKPWTGIWKANTKYKCLQYNHFPLLETDPVEGTEDCLYLNVYTPNLTNKLDVIVYIHGGAFIFGSGASYQPHILLDRDVVYVSMNYRLGPLGFLSTEDDTVPGNNGLKDQILALKWIKENIQFFGGNPNSITITGMSAGGASVHFHTLSPKSKGYFNRAISMSGCMLNPWVIMENPLERSKELAWIVGCDTGNIEIMIDCLRRRSAKQIVAVVGKFQPWLFNPFSPFALVIDKWSSDPVLPNHPLQLLKHGSVSDTPWISSHTSGEGLYPGYDFYRSENLKYIDENWNEIIPHILHYNSTVKPSAKQSVTKKIREQYFGDNHISRNTFNQLVNMIGDRLFKVDIEKCTRLHAAAIKSPVFHYVFDYRGAHSRTERRGITENIGVSHADDTAYVLKCDMDTLSTKDDRNISKLMVDSFVTFAKYGEPKIELEWPPISKKLEDPMKYLKIKSKSSLEEAATFGNRKFWDSWNFKRTKNCFQSKMNY
ncbi:hypothetical protein HHI36_015615, partial [Cryptolaemus montrouzieri]